MPRVAAARLLEIALNPPAEAMRIPFTANMESPVESWVPLLMRPVVVPELWARMRPDEIDPRFLIDNNYLEPLKDFDYKGERLLASLCHNPQAAAHGG